jgi:septal ring factor EnvC (AmiA/AmiB activator)
VAVAWGLALLHCQTYPHAQQPADRSRTEARSRQAAERLQTLQREADRLAADERTLLNELRRLEVGRQIKAERLNQASADANRARAELDATTARIEQLEHQDFAERPALRARLVEIYKLGRGRYFRLLLSAHDGRDLGRALRMVGALARLDRDRVAEYQGTLEALKSARADLQTRAQRTEALRLDAQAAEAAAASAAQARAALVSDIDRRRDLNAQLAGELQSAQQKLQATLRDLASGVPAKDTALPLRPFRGALDWPATGAVRRASGQAGNARERGSGAIEIAAPEGAPVRAVHDGSVGFADTFAGFGNLVILDHGGQAFTLYGDLLDVLVDRGGAVEQGQVIGHVGRAPAGGPGLYFELRIDGRAVDPLQWLKSR